MPAAMLCETPVNCRGETCRNIGKRKTKYACIVDADETMRIRLGGVPRRYHADHISAKGKNSLSRYNLVHKFIPMSQALKNSRCGGCSGKRVGQSEKNTAWQLTKVKNKKELIEEAMNRGRKVHFASLMDLCHLKNSELEPQYQKHKGRVLFRGDNVKDDSGSYAVFAERGSSASQVTAQRSWILFQDYRDAQDKQQTQYPLTPGRNGRCTDVIENSMVRMSRYLDTSNKTQMAQNHGPVWKTQLFLLDGICSVTFWQDHYGKGNLRKFY